MLSTYSSHDHTQAFSEFLAYKTRVPVRGAILLNDKMDEVLLVKGWKKGANWSFPRGKINKDEPDLDCAIREVYEETGYDIEGAGLVPDKEHTKYIEMNLREQHMRLYVFRGIPMDTFFEPRTRKEISKIQWWRLSDLPTLRRKKQPQDGQGGDLAINANKFYMVAPFLPQLKKWISAQRRLDKARQTSLSAPVPTVTDEETAATADHDNEEGKVPLSMNGAMGKLLEGLRQSAQPVQTSPSPEVTGRSAATEDMVTQLKGFLGVPTDQPAAHQNNDRQSVPEPVSNPKADSLLALLQSKPTQSVQLPQTPMEQVIETPDLPSSPPHPHHQPQRFSSMPPPPSFPTQNQITAVESRSIRPPQPPKTRPIPPPRQPPQLISRNAHHHSHKNPQAANVNQQNVAPYQRTGDPQFAQHAQAPGNQPSSVPRASKLPPPKLNAQSSTLLNLFKASVPAKTPDGCGNAEALSKTTQPAVTETPILDAGQESKGPRSEENIVHQGKAREASRPRMFVPPQVLSGSQSAKQMDAVGPKAGHHDKLLNLFKSPFVVTAEPVKPATPTLQLPSAPIELSALPTTPGHSREPSRVKEAVEDQAPSAAQDRSVTSNKRLRHNTASLQNPPVAATISGPLNIPQFDMVAKASKEAKQAVYNRDHGKSPKRSPIRILTRPTSSYEQPILPQHQTSAKTAPEMSTTKHHTAAAPHSQTFVTPVKKPPPTPDLKAHEAPPKGFHPQILRRPAHLDDSSEPSPIQPLPSPKHNVLTNNRPIQPGDNKKSLLSLFIKSSPAISPPLAAPVSAIDPSALISPLAGPTPKEQAEAAFARLSKSVGKLSHEPDAAPGNAQPPLLRTGSIQTAVAQNSSTGLNSGKQKPTSKTTPVDKAFLLGFLNSVAEGGR